MDEATGNGGFAGDQSRRDALKKVGIGAAGAAAVWSAPSILSVTAAAAATGGGGGGGCPGCGLENILNGSFENLLGPAPVPGFFLPADWTVTGNGIAFNYNLLSGTPPPGNPGTYSGADYDGGSVLSQTFPVGAACVGKSYLFSFWAWSFAGTGAGTLTFNGTNPLQTVTLSVPNQPAAPVSYSQFTNAAPVPAGTTSVTVTFTTQVQMGVDLVSFIIGC